MRSLCRGTKGFHFVDSSGPLLAKDRASGGSHHDIFLDADAAKIPVGFEPVGGELLNMAYGQINQPNCKYQRIKGLGSAEDIPTR